MDKILKKIENEIKEVKQEQETAENKEIFKDYGFKNYKEFSEKFDLNNIESRIYDNGYIEGMKNARDIYINNI